MLIEHPESVTIVAFDGPDAVVVIQPRPGTADPTVELPAGCLEPGEDAAQAAARELREECSLAAVQWRLLGTFWAAPAYSTELVHVFEARGLTASAGRPDPDEHITVGRRPLSELPGALSDATSIAAFALWAASGRPPAVETQ
ncbi:MAG TPA: NUDIX hydrolase [Solirubrobacteraceae bacterium]|nr:NUDIX hydrolase [Solirubrobacteraceae bacterium]